MEGKERKDKPEDLQSWSACQILSRKNVDDLSWKVDLDRWDLFIYCHCLIRLKISEFSKKNLLFKNNSQLNALGSKFDLDVK